MVDFTALVVGAKTISALNSSRLHHTGERSELSVVYLASMRNEDGEEDFSTLAVLRIWGGLEVPLQSFFASLSFKQNLK